MGAIWSIARKDLRLLARDKAGLFWVLGFPLLIAVMFGSIFGGDPSTAGKMKIAIDDLDKSKSSQAFVSQLKSSSAVDLSSVPMVQAMESVRKGDIVAAVQIPKGFEDSGFFSGNAPELKLAIDPAQKAEAGMIRGLIAEASFAPMKEIFSDPNRAKSDLDKSRQTVKGSHGMNPERKDQLMTFFGAADKMFDVMPASGGSGSGAFSGPKVVEVNVSPTKVGPDSAFEITFPQGIIWGLVAVAIAFAVGTVKERVSGTYTRLSISPMTRAQYLLGKALACFIGCAAVISLLLLIGKLIFHLSFTSPALLVVAIISSSVAFVGITMLLSVVFKSQEAASGAGRAVLLLMSVFGGGMVPQIMMPEWMLKLASFSPVKWAILSLEGAMWRHFSFTEMMLPCGILLGIGLATFFAGNLILQRTTD